MTRGDRRRGLIVAGLLLLALLPRLGVARGDALSYDDATVGLVAKYYLGGEAFPAFFYRQAYMGALNGVHLVPALFLFGPSIWLLRLNAIAWSLLFPWLLYVLGRRLFDEPTARVALLLAAVPPFLLTNWSTLAEPHFETNLFGLVLLLLALAALAAEPASPRYARILAGFGLTAGLAWWTNFKALEVILPALLVLGLRAPSLPLRRAGALLAGGFLLGSLPVWIFYGVGVKSVGNTLAAVYPSVFAYPVTKIGYYFVATREPVPLETVRARLEAVAIPELKEPLRAALRGLIEYRSDPGFPVLTDDLAPVDQLIYDAFFRH